MKKIYKLKTKILLKIKIQAFFNNKIMKMQIS